MRPNMPMDEARAASQHPTVEELLVRLAPILPAIKERIAAADLARDTPAETVRELAAADLFRLFQPQQWGGFESDPRIFFALQNAIAQVCPSTAWVYGVLCVQSFLVSLFDEQAQADVWERDGRALIGSAGTPAGTATPVEGGFRVTGRWTFSSGSSHAKWALLGARLPDAPVAGPPLLNVFLVPREDFELVDVWHSFGLRATGSNDIIANDIFVPKHRTITLDPGIQNIRREMRAGPALYRLPWLYLFSSSISNLAIGTARAALDGFLSITRSRVSVLTGKIAREDPAVQQAAGRLASEIEAAPAMYDRHVERLLHYEMIDTPIPMQEAVLIRTQLTAGLRKFASLVDDLMMLQGARATDLNSPVTRAWLDLNAARAHLGNDPTMATTMLGAMLIGQG
ncbi:acyl-CoA dehydrogenase family protein [Rhizorhapis suberifaciens]|uniref:acyl-CoA dehydrogenase family protein n=1 Tax=Rhizorhapis suberifaciens TaxID=13656 RepID=UPI002ADE32B1|nr:acyl-CoA dehydrogenase family protein [Rhizorhapis suberifaciens]